MLPSASLSSALSRTTDEATCSSFIVRKGLSHEFFTFVPERLRRRRIERISAYSFAHGADGHVVRISEPGVLQGAGHAAVNLRQAACDRVRSGVHSTHRAASWMF